MHLNLDDAVSAAGFAASAFYIKAETPFAVALGLGICRGSKQIPDLVKHACIGGRVGTGRTADGRLVYGDHLIQQFHSPDFPVLSGNASGTVQIPGQTLIQYLVNQRAFPGA